RTATSDTTTAGTVISQDPGAGSSVTEGSSVSLVVSSGPLGGPPSFVVTSPAEPEQNPAECCGGSVYLANGQFHVERTDLTVPGRGGVNFAFKRIYKSNVQGNGPLGVGWSHVYDMRIRRIDPSTLEWLTGTGRAERFTLQADGSYKSPTGFFVKLIGSDAGWTIRLPDGTRYVFNDLGGANAPGYVVQIVDRHGNQLELTYGTTGNGAGKLVSVKDPYDRTFNLSYNAAGRIKMLEDYAGRTVTYRYDSQNHLIEVTGPAITQT